MKDRKLPDIAIDVIDEVGAYCSLKSSKSKAKPIRISVNEIKHVIAKMTKIPLETLTNTDRQLLKNLDERLRSVVFGQNMAIDALVNVIRLAKSGLEYDEKPIGSFLFSGPTGVGKTELAKQLAKNLGVSFVRIDMSEYMEKHTVSKLIGSPPGYVGYNEGGQLTDAINRNPHSVLLLDEIEKAHPDVHNILLQVMDRGVLTDSNGRESDFRNVILILTTNAGAADLTRESIGFERLVANKGGEKKALAKAFSPEFRNRFDSIISFNNLSQENMKHITGKILKDLEEKLKKKKIALHITKEALEKLSKDGYDPHYGARPLSRIIQEKVKKPLAKEILFGELNSRLNQVTIDEKEGEFVFSYS